MLDPILRIADQAATLGDPSAGPLVTAARTGARRGELAGLQYQRVDLDHGTNTIGPHAGSLHEPAHAM